MSGGGAGVPRERKLTAQRLKQRLDQLTRDLEKRERPTRPLAWYEEQAAEAELEALREAERLAVERRDWQAAAAAKRGIDELEGEAPTVLCTSSLSSSTAAATTTTSDSCNE